MVRELAVFLPRRERTALATSAWACGSPKSSSAVLDGPLAAVASTYAPRPGDGEQALGPQRRGEAFAELLRDTADPDVERRWSAVSCWSRQVPLLSGGQSR